MSELSPEAKALLSNARSGLGPDAAAISRVRAGVAATVAVPPPPPSPTSAAASAAAKVGAAVSTKLAVIGVISAVVATTSYLAVKHGPTTSVPAPAIRLDVVPERIAPVPQRDPAPVAATREELVLPPERVAQPPVAAPRASALAEPEHAAAEPAATRSHNTAKHGPALGRESQLLDAARASFERGDYARAVTYLTTYDHETAGAGQMAEDAAALEIEIACRRHDASAQTQLEGFDQRWPSSTYRVRLANACETE